MQLGKNECYSRFAHEFVSIGGSKNGFICRNEGSWIRNLEQNISPKFQLHAETLLFELHTKMCTVEILACLLEKCGLLKALSILSLPGNFIVFLL